MDIPELINCVKTSFRMFLPHRLNCLPANANEMNLEILHLVCNLQELRKTEEKHFKFPRPLSMATNHSSH
jgi:hypothetical protein